jgi:hypothetical protein
VDAVRLGLRVVERRLLRRGGAKVSRHHASPAFRGASRFLLSVTNALLEFSGVDTARPLDFSLAVGGARAVAGVGENVEEFFLTTLLLRRSSVRFDGLMTRNLAIDGDTLSRREGLVSRWSVGLAKAALLAHIDDRIGAGFRLAKLLVNVRIAVLNPPKGQDILGIEQFLKLPP